MITAGYFIGQLLDDLASIGGQVANRNKVGMTDLTKLLENFYRDIINDIFGYSLKNANEGRSNAPGLDLIDDVRGIGIQVTSQGGSGKISDMLEVLTAEQISLYPRIVIMIAGTKQKSYTGLRQEFIDKAKFKIEDIWDYTDLCKALVNLPLDKLQGLHQLVSQQVARVKIELEIPNEDGTFATGIEQYAEAIPRERLSDLKKFAAFLHADMEATEDDTRKFVETFVADLKELPRITREIFEYMWTRRERTLHRGAASDRYKVSHTKLERLLERYRDLEGDLRLLNDAGFITTYAPHETGDGSFFHVLREGSASDLLDRFGLVYLDQFMTEHGIESKKVFVSLDFGEF
ncbi:hypothetical protein ELH50_37640 [Rhizobium ruizarguesonis]|uniref:SMEK domain-containing protein n=1 Tax=Rhizobium ruizarguesonis TaxID=2081791 RepID=UPI001031CC62|nr:SMEK domain-containing protein [Rhizobium ruizarguesonis]TBA77390.1 hypothetical protein ELH54_28230 [Rhizobium ruizarguesonis]TBA95317.1 hypothetical protein ELH50_37640 [Rhizobium ruizarguesonis]